MPFSCVTGGQFSMHGLFLDLSWGLHDAVTFDISVPFVLHAEFVDEVDKTVVRGAGDLRFGVRAGGVERRFAWAMTTHVVAPTGVRTLEHRDIPLGEGHWGVEPGIRLGWSGGRWGWLETHESIRLRIPTLNAGVTAGHEWVGVVSGGFTPHPQLAFTTGLEWMLAMDGQDSFGVGTPGRKLLQARAGVGWKGGQRIWVGANVAIPLAGSKWPTGPVFHLSVAGRIKLWGE